MLSFNAWSAQLAFMTTTSDGVGAIRLWTQYHRAIGVDLFYMFVNGQVRRCHQPCHSSSLRQRPGVPSALALVIELQSPRLLS